MTGNISPRMEETRSSFITFVYYWHRDILGWKHMFMGAESDFDRDFFELQYNKAIDRFHEELMDWEDALSAIE